MTQAESTGQSDAPTTDAAQAPESTPEDAPQAAGEASAAEASEQPEAKSKPKAAPVEEQPLPDDFNQRVEAAVMTLDRAISAAKLGELLGGFSARQVTDAVAALNDEYEQTGRAFRIEQIAGGCQVMTLPKYADVLAALHRTRSQSKLSPSALETLAIIAYKQPILRAEVETIRGVACGEVIRSLMERQLVKIVGRAEEIGRPMLYGTTKHFLEVFGLSSLKDLPNARELKAGQ